MPDQFAIEIDMKGSERPEERRTPRVTMPPGTMVETNGQTGHLLDVSPLGARVETRGSIRPNERLSLAWRKNGRLVETRGVVVWSEANLAGNELSYRAGIEFLEPVSLRDTGFVGEDFGLPA